jgi:hypothetical protein
MSSRLAGAENTDNCDSSRSSPAPSSSQPHCIPSKQHPVLPPIDGDDIEASDDENGHELSLHRSLTTVLKQTGHPQFVGKSSAFLLLQQALDMKESATVASGTGDFNAHRATFQNVCGESWIQSPVSPILSSSVL